MGNSNSPSEPDGAESRSPDETFALLGDATRVGILQVLWDAFESGMGHNAVRYSEIFDRVEIDDSGNFSYHLEKLTGPFVRRTDRGYELKQTGINVVRAVTVGTVIDDPTFGPTAIDVDCPLCEGPVEITYTDEVMDVSCTACEGRIRWRGKSGHIFGALVPPVAIEQRTVEETFQAAVVYTLHRVASFHDGVCAHCAGPVETIVDVCADHSPGEGSRCPNCDRTNMVELWMGCSTCKLSLPPPVTLTIFNEPDVTAFYHERGIPHRFATWDTVTRSYRVGEELLSEEPLRMSFTIPAGDEELRLTLDEALNVLEATR